jgi:hypothetical protein
MVALFFILLLLLFSLVSGVGYFLVPTMLESYQN